MTERKERTVAPTALPRGRTASPGSGPWREWSDDADGDREEQIRVLTRAQAQALKEKNPSISPWRVIAAQAAVGCVVAVLAWVLTRRLEVAWSALYGAAAVFLPGALLARGMTSKLSMLSPGASAVSFMLWEFMKIGVSVVMLALAPKLIQALSWPALLVALIVCIKVYWLALLWRGR
jgi:ATP synthase protein I